MARPFIQRRVSSVPKVTYFKPRGVPMRFLETTSLGLEEFEAIRLKDLEGLEQEEAAKLMNVSRPTFQRVLAKARKKIAEALYYGKAIKVSGGNAITPNCDECDMECETASFESKVCKKMLAESTVKDE